MDSFIFFVFPLFKTHTQLINNFKKEIKKILSSITYTTSQMDTIVSDHFQLVLVRS